MPQMFSEELVSIRCENERFARKLESSKTKPRRPLSFRDITFKQFIAALVFIQIVDLVFYGVPLGPYICLACSFIAVIIFAPERLREVMIKIYPLASTIMVEFLFPNSGYPIIVFMLTSFFVMANSSMQPH